MGVVQWRGGATATAQVNTLTPSGFSAADVVTLTINGKEIEVTATSGVASELVALLVTAVGQYDNTIAEWSEVSASGTGALVLTGPTDGKPFTVSAAITGAGSISNIATTSPTGPYHWDEANNWDTGAVPINSDDVYFQDSDIDCLYGLAQSAVTLASLHIKASYTGKLGLQNWNGDYYEYRATMLAIGATLCYIGEGEGSGSQRLKIDFGSVQTSVYVTQTGTAEDSAAGAFSMAGTHASNALYVNRGTVGVAMNEPEQDSKLATLSIGYIESEETDSVVQCGAGMTQLTTITQNGGELIFASNVTTFTQRAGEAAVEGTATVATADVNGVFYYASSGTMTQAYVRSSGSLNFTRDLRAKTVTDCSIFGGGEINDRLRVVTWTNPIELDGCSISDCTLELGTHITLDVATGT